MWLAHWGLGHDPFDPDDTRWIAIPSHERVAADLRDRIRAGPWPIVLRGPSGIGKSGILREVARRLRRPGVRIPLAGGPLSPPDLCARWATQILGAWTPADGSAPARLADAIRLCRLQGESVIFAWDANAEGPPPELPIPGRVPLVITSREDDVKGLSVPPLTRTQAADYLASKLARAGHPGPAFAGPALTRLHAQARGIPARLDALARAGMQAAARRGGSEVIHGDLADDAALADVGMVGPAGSW